MAFSRSTQTCLFVLVCSLGRLMIRVRARWQQTITNFVSPAWTTLLKTHPKMVQLEIVLDAEAVSRLTDMLSPPY